MSGAPEFTVSCEIDVPPSSWNEVVDADFPALRGFLARVMTVPYEPGGLLDEVSLRYHHVKVQFDINGEAGGWLRIYFQKRYGEGELSEARMREDGLYEEDGELKKGFDRQQDGFVYGRPYADASVEFKVEDGRLTCDHDISFDPSYEELWRRLNEDPELSRYVRETFN